MDGAPQSEAPLPAEPHWLLWLKRTRKQRGVLSRSRLVATRYSCTRLLGAEALLEQVLLHGYAALLRLGARRVPTTVR